MLVSELDSTQYCFGSVLDEIQMGTGLKRNFSGVYGVSMRRSKGFLERLLGVQKHSRGLFSVI